MKKIITVFAGSRCRTNKEKYYYNLAYEFGKLVAENGYALASGGGPGLMDQAMKGAYDAGGETIGILFKRPGRTYSQYCKITEAFTEIRPRQEKLISLGDFFVALPGGIGALYEIIEIIELKKIGKIDKAKSLILIDSYYLSFKKIIENIVDEGFASLEILNQMKFVKSSDEVFQIIK